MAATTNAQPNAFNITGFVATDATIKSFESSAVARFALSLSRREGKGDEIVRKSALINCEVWGNSADCKRFALLKKGQLVIVSGYIKPENYTDRQGNPQSRITFVCTSVGSPNGTMTAKITAKAETATEPVHETEVVPF